MASSSPCRASSAAARGHRPAVAGSSSRMRSRAADTSACASTDVLIPVSTFEHLLAQLLNAAYEVLRVAVQLPTVRAAVALLHRIDSPGMVFREERGHIATAVGVVQQRERQPRVDRRRPGKDLPNFRVGLALAKQASRGRER